MNLRPNFDVFARRLALLPVLLLVLAACTTSSPGASVAESEGAVASEGAGGEASVLVAESDLGQILTDPDGNTIYYFANDTEGVSNCDAGCIATWPPVEASGTPTAGDGVTAAIGTITRDDGTTQLTVNGFPAYRYADDAAAGDTNGQGVGDVWWVFGVDGEPMET